VSMSQLFDNLGLALLRLSRHTEARAAFEQAVTLAPGHVRAHLNFAAAALVSGDTNTACREVDIACRLAPRNPDALQSAADLQAITGHPSNAAALYRQALSLQPDRPSLRRRLAWLLATCPDPSVRNGAEALRLAQSLVAANEGLDPEILETLAAALAETGDAPRAAQVQAQIVAGPGSTPAREARLACYRAGRPWRDTRLSRSPDAGVVNTPP
jgi:tetratricopeptide (TPR) repeat protein